MFYWLNDVGLQDFIILILDSTDNKMSKGNTSKPSLAVDYVNKLMDNIYDMIENRNFAGKKLSTSENEKGQAAILLEKYSKIYLALDDQNIKTDEGKIGRQYQSQMRELISNFGEASDDSIKQMTERLFKKRPEYKKQVNVALFHIKCSLKKLKQVEAIVKVPSHISIESKIKEEFEAKFAYESFFRDQDFSRLETLANSTKQLSLKKGMKKLIGLNTSVVRLEKQLNQYTQYSKDSNVKHLQWEKRLVEPVLKLKQKVWHLKAHEQHFEWLGNTLSSLSRGEIVDINQKKGLLKDQYMENSLNTLSNQMKLSVQKSKQLYNKITEIITTYKFENDPILASSVIDSHKMSSKIIEEISNNRTKQIEKTLKTWFQFGNQAKDVVLESAQDTKMTQSPLKESDLKEILAFIKKKPQPIYSNINSSRIICSPNLSKNNSQISSPDENKNEEFALVRQAFIENCKLILPEIAEDNQYSTTSQILKIYLKRNNEIKERIKNWVKYETQATQLDSARQELDKEIELREKAEMRVRQIEEQYQKLSQQHSYSVNYVNSLIQQKDNLINDRKQRQAEFTDQLIERQRQIGELTRMNSKQQSIIDLLTQQLNFLQKGQPSQQLNALHFKLNIALGQLSAAQNQIFEAQKYINWQKEQIDIHTSNNQELKLQLQQREQNLQELKQQIGKFWQQKVDAQSKAADSIKQLKQQHEREKNELKKNHKIFIDKLEDKHKCEKDKIIADMKAPSSDNAALLQKHEEEKSLLIRHHQHQIEQINKQVEQLGRAKAQLEKSVEKMAGKIKELQIESKTAKQEISRFESELQAQKLSAVGRINQYEIKIQGKDSQIKTISNKLNQQILSLTAKIANVEAEKELKIKTLQQQLTSIQGQKEEVDQQLIDEVAKNKQLQLDLEELRQKLNQISVSNTNHQIQNDIYKANLAEKQAAVTRLQINIDNLAITHQSDIDSIKSEHIEQLERLKQQKTQELRKKEDEINALVKEKQDIIKQNKAKIMEFQKRVLEQDEKYSAVLMDLVTVQSQADAKFQKLQAQNKVLDAKIKDIQNQIKQKGNLLEREKSSTKNLQQKLSQQKENSKKWQQKLAAAELQLKKKPTVSSQIILRSKQIKQLDEKIQKRKQQINFIQSASPRADRYNQLAKQYSLCPLFTAFISSLFSGEVLQQEFDMKIRLVRHIEAMMKSSIKSTKLIFRYDSLNPTNFHKYIDNRSSIVCVVKLTNGNYIACYYSGTYCKGEQMVSPSLIMSLTANQSYELYNPTTNNTARTFRGMTYDDFFLIFGNAEMRIRASEKTIFSNFGIGNSFFNNRGAKVHHILGAGDNREIEFDGYEIYELALEADEQ